MSSIVNHPTNTSLQLPAIASISSKEEDEAHILKCIQDLVAVTTSFRIKWSQDSHDEDKPLLNLIEDVISELPLDPLCILSSHEKIARKLRTRQKEEPRLSNPEHECLGKPSDNSSSSNNEDSDSSTDATNLDSDFSEFSSSDESFSTTVDHWDEPEITKMPLSLDTSQNRILDVRHEPGGAIATTRETPNGLGRHTRWSYPCEQRSLTWRAIVGIEDTPLSDPSAASPANISPPALVQPESVNEITAGQLSSPVQPSTGHVSRSKSPRKRSLDEVDANDVSDVDPPSPSRRPRTL